MRLHDPVQAVRTFFMQNHIRNVQVTAALSGGADSVCLLHCLLAVRSEFGLDIAALHVQHQLRGAESERDEVFCKQLCSGWDVPLTVVTADVQTFRKAHGCSVETAARECRYAAFAQTEGLVATAHTASDNLETMLFRLARGSGLKGLCGIPPVRERYIRPLLTVTRTEIEQYLSENNIPYVTDSTNLSEDYTRNFLRHNVVPQLRRVNPSLERTASETAGLLRDEEDFLNSAAKAAFAEARQPDGSLRGLSELHPALQKRCIRMLLEENGIRTDLGCVTMVQKLLEHGGRTELVRNGIWACVSRDVLFLQMKPAETLSSMLQLGKNSIFFGHFVEAELILRSDSKKFASVHKKFTDSVLDYDIIKGYAVLHARQPGLKLLPAGRNHHVSVKKWLNACVPPAERQFVHFLSDDSGLLWAEGLGVSAHAAVTEQTQRMLVLSVSKKLSQN